MQRTRSTRAIALAFAGLLAFGATSCGDDSDGNGRNDDGGLEEDLSNTADDLSQDISEGVSDASDEIEDQVDEGSEEDNESPDASDSSEGNG